MEAKIIKNHADNKVINFFTAITKRMEPRYSIRLVEFEYSKKHGHKICVMQLVGKNSFPKFTAEEILSNNEIMIGLSPIDAVKIAKLDADIKNNNLKSTVLEIDRNGSVLIEDEKGHVSRFSENLVTNNEKILNNLSSKDAHDLGYRVGFRHGLSTMKEKMKIANKLKSKVISLFKS